MKTLKALAVIGLLVSAGAWAQQHDHTAPPASPVEAASMATCSMAQGDGMKRCNMPMHDKDHGKTMTPKMKAAHHQALLQAAMQGDWRDPKNVARDPYRHPQQTLSVFGVTPHSQLIEIWPGAGWYSEILVPYVSKHGRYTAAVNNPLKIADPRSRDYYAKQNQALREKFAARPDIYGKAEVLEFDPAQPVFGAPASADVVLTFRNVHNWRMAKQAEGMFAGFFAVLKPGGTLGVVEHRAAQDVADNDKSGYVSEAQVIALATQAGFRLVGKSEINANPKDTKDYSGGVWSLPPTYGEGETNREKYQAIGESDRMTLKFVKP